MASLSACGQGRMSPSTGTKGFLELALSSRLIPTGHVPGGWDASQLSVTATRTGLLPFPALAGTFSPSGIGCRPGVVVVG